MDKTSVRSCAGKCCQGSWARLVACLTICLLGACAPATPTVWPTAAPPVRWPASGRPEPVADRAEPAATAADSVAILMPEATPTSVPQPGDEGLAATLREFQMAIGTDPTGAKTQAYVTLSNFVDPRGVYSSAWWFHDDGRADIYEVLAVIFYTEGNTNFDVRSAVAARYLWYCGGTATACEGPALINFLSYFQPWREPWISRGFMSERAGFYEDLASDVVNQAPGLLTAMIPGADTYEHSRDGLSLGGPIDWSRTPFHFANVHPTWDSFLRANLRRLPNGPARLWVLTMSEASRVCASQFICPDMTQARQ